MSLEELRKKRQQLKEASDITLNNMNIIANESYRVAEVANDAEDIIDDLEKKFEEQTGLTQNDVTLLFLATGLQIARQYLLSNEKYRLTSTEGDKLMQEALSETPPEWQDVLLSSVPYDAIKTSSHISDTGLSGATHRYRTLGHDPIFGWIFGTANIMTNSLTKTDFVTYQVKNMKIIRHYPLGVVGMMERAIAYSKNDIKLLAVAIARQAVHFGSDYFTKQGLPVPGVSMISDELVKKMITKGHIDMYSIARGAGIAIFINQIIALIHSLFALDLPDDERKLYEVRTRKIISYSNLLATSSNVAVVAITKDFNKLDIGGMAVTIYRLITDAEFIREVKEEFVFGGFKKMIQGDELDIKEVQLWD